MGLEQIKSKEPKEQKIEVKKKDKNELGEEFILEDWEVFNEKNKNMDNSIKFDSDLLFFIPYLIIYNILNPLLSNKYPDLSINKNS